MQQYDFMAGATLLIDKPLEWTSFDVVNKVRFALKKALNVRKIKVGHAGTLDPLATGLLIICTGKFTKKIDSYQALYKVYDGQFQLGATTPSYDAEQEINARFDTSGLTAEKIRAVVPQFLGELEQVPPQFSAIKVNGKPLYKSAREGKEVRVKSRQVTIHDFQLPQISDDFKVDFGKALNNGAYLTKLRRTHIGEYALSDAWQLDDLMEYIKNNCLPAQV